MNYNFCDEKRFPVTRSIIQLWKHRQPRTRDHRPAKVSIPFCNAFAALVNFTQPFNEHAATAGLPTEDGNRLNPTNLLRAARRTGLAGKVVKRKIKKISSDLSPVLFAEERRRSCSGTRGISPGC